jgi:hypothetical protein
MKTVPLHGRKAAGRVALVDDEDYDLVMQYRWHVREEQRPGRRRPNGPYARTNVRIGDRSTTIAMHSLLTGWPLTDHADHNGLNNQRYNLRPATFTENNANKREQAGTSSRFKGVCWAASTLRTGEQGRWLARIEANDRAHYLGKFACEEDAARAYDAAARRFFGAYACLNFPGDTKAA